jgi:hypothetical protein
MAMEKKTASRNQAIDFRDEDVDNERAAPFFCPYANGAY